jgi:hypothetical protein
VITENTKQPNLSLYFNLLFDKTRFNSPDTLVSMFGDDMVFDTKGWEDTFLRAMNAGDGKVLVYGDDGYIAHERLSVHFVMSRDRVLAAGQPFMCPLFSADMIDLVHYLAGVYTGTLCYLPNVLIRHEHFTKGSPADWDATAQRIAPVQNCVRTKENQALAGTYATMLAGELVKHGYGKWDKL